MARILVTGADGFLGGALARALTVDNEVLGLGSPRKLGEVSSGFQREVMPLDSPEMAALIERYKPDFLLHAAGSSNVGRSVGEPLNDFLRNVPAWMHVLDAVRRGAPDCQCILLSSAAVYGNPRTMPVREEALPAPVSPYGYHKLMCEAALEEYVRLHGLQGATIRIFSAYGPGLRRQVIWDLVRKASCASHLSLSGCGDESRDFVHVDDVIGAVHRVISHAPLRGETYNLASGVETPIRRIAEMVCEETSCDGPHFDGSRPAGIPIQWRADITKLAQLGWKPEVVPVEDGIRATIRWCLAQSDTV